MKVNPVSIQTYQQVARREQPGRPPAAGEREGNIGGSLAIEPQPNLSGSKLAVKAPAGSYADFLTAEEKQALEILFGKFTDTSRFGAGYRAAENGQSPDVTVGRIIDLKV